MRAVITSRAHALTSVSFRCCCSDIFPSALIGSHDGCVYLLDASSGAILWQLDVECDDRSRSVSASNSASASSSSLKADKPVPIAASPSLMMELTAGANGAAAAAAGGSPVAPPAQQPERFLIANQRGLVVVAQIDARSASIPSATVLGRSILPAGAAIFSTGVCVDGSAWLGARNNALYGLRVRFNEEAAAVASRQGGPLEPGTC